MMAGGTVPFSGVCLSLRNWQDPTFFPVFLLPKLWAIEIICRNLEPPDLKMQSDFQSVVVKGRINCRLPGKHNVLHLRISKYPGYSLFNPLKIWGTVFAVLLLTLFICSAPMASTVSSKGNSCLLPALRKSTMNELYRIWGWRRNRTLSDCVVSATFLLQKKRKYNFPVSVVISLVLTLVKMIFFIGYWNKPGQSSLRTFLGRG